MASSSDAGTQFKGLRTLISGNVDRVPEGRVSFSSGFRKQQFAAFQLKHGVTPSLVVPLRNLIRLGQQLEPSRTLSGFAMDAGEQAQIVWHPQPSARFFKFLQGRIVSRTSLFGSALLCDRPGPHECAPRTVIVELVFLAEAARLLRCFESRLRLTPELMEHGQASKRTCDTERVRDLAGNQQGVLGRVQCAIRVAEMPVAVPDIGVAEDAHVDAVHFGVVVAVRAARFQTSLKPITGCLEGAEMKCRNSGEMISLHE